MNIQSFSYKVTENISYILLITGCIYSGIFIYLNEPSLYLPGLITIFILLISLFLLKIKKILLSRYVLILAANIATLYFAILLGPLSGIHDFFYGLFILNFILFGLSHIWHQVIGIIVSILLWVLTLYIQSYQDPIFIISEMISFVLVILTGIMNFIILGFSLNIFIQSIISYQKQHNEREFHLKNAYEELKKSKSSSEALTHQSAYASLTKGITHEIKNPLQMIYGRAEMLLENPNDTKAIKTFAEVTIRNIDRLNKLIRSMLSYGSSSDNKEKFSVNELLNDIYTLSQHRCNFKQIHLKKEFCEDINIIGNKTYIYQAILNLVVNAIQYTDSGGSIFIKNKLEEYTNKDGLYLHGIKIDIEDTGVGIPQDTLGRIFEPYYTTKKASENIGLGLSMAFKTITENNGSIKVKSEEGKGTIFSIYLPLIENESNQIKP